MLVVGGGTFAAAAALASKSEVVRSPACGPEASCIAVVKSALRATRLS